MDREKREGQTEIPKIWISQEQKELFNEIASIFS